ncbi:MAG: hypothetical protein KMY53_03450 [Desulfarculus sp.]|nr:hypothetical protein [Pseudomonadota bacterium]MBU4599762.1 hypothetical protein [Pseudomonadota bacterium]MBV1716180.1 hypothetical protein [Desulfarculus sp.]MBV1737196.1 hypothetical protein [Desulfarculus sp.]
MNTPKQETPEELPRDRPFNPHRRPRTDKARAIVADITNQFQNFERHHGLRKRSRRQVDQETSETQMSAIVCDLMHRVLTKPDGWVAVPLSKEVLGRKDRYKSPVMRETLPVLLEHLATPEMNFIELSKGYAAYSNHFGPGRQTTIRAGKRLLSRVREHGVELSDLKLSPDGEVIILKRPKDNYWDGGGKVDYTDDDTTNAYRREVADINQWLAQADITFDEYYEGEKVVDYTDRHLERVFNNSSFEQGGRLFGGFWQRLHKDVRRAGISINGEDVVSLDYSQMAPRLLYALEGATPPQDDAYFLPGLEDYRPGIKKVFNAALYSQKPLERLPSGTASLFPKRIGISPVMDGLQEVHAPIFQHFFTGIGYNLMFRESEILIDVLLQVMEAGVVGLPVFDAVVVPASGKQLTKSIMESVFKQHTGIRGMVEEE